MFVYLTTNLSTYLISCKTIMIIKPQEQIVYSRARASVTLYFGPAALQELLTSLCHQADVKVKMQRASKLFVILP